MTKSLFALSSANTASNYMLTKTFILHTTASYHQAERYIKVEPTKEHCRLLTLELIFLWHALPTCSKDDLKPLLEGKISDSQRNSATC